MDSFDHIANEIKNFKQHFEIKKWQTFDLDFSIDYSNKNEVYNLIKLNIQDYQNISGFYAIYQKDECLYIGIGKKIWERIKSHYNASKGQDKAKKWANFFSNYQTTLTIYWLEYEPFENFKQSHKLREIIENILELKYKPKFEFQSK